MATADDYAAWIVANADKKGTPDFDTVVQAYQAAKSEKPAAASTGGNWSASRAIGEGMADPIHGGAQLLTRALPTGVVDAGNKLNNWLADKTGLVGKLPEGGVDQMVKTREQEYAAARAAAGRDGIDWLRLGGNALSPVNLALGAAAPAAAATLPARAGVSAAIGAGSAALQPATSDNFASEKLKQMAGGAIGGAAAPVVAAGLGRVISPKASTNPELELLKQAGVRPTVGQTLGGRWNAVEEKAMSIPITGDAIANARQRALEQFNKAAINRAVSPVGETVNDIGQLGVAKAGDVLSGKYDAGKAALGFFRIDQQGAAELSTLRSMANQLPNRERKAFNDVWTYMQGEVSPNGSITAEGFKRIDSKISKEAARFGGSTDAYQKQAGDALKELQRVIVENAKRANPGAAEQLAKADKGWANLVRVEGAAKSAKNADGVFTPAQLNMAIQAADKSTRKRSVARGEALMQDLASAGQNVLGNKVPNSFTTDRALIAGGGLGAYFVDPLIPSALLGGAAAYSQPAQWAMRGLLSERPASAKTIAELFKKSAPMLAPAGGLLGVEFAK